MASRSPALALGRRLLGSILCTSSGTSPVPSFSTSRWLRKSSSLLRSRMFIIVVGRHEIWEARRACGELGAALVGDMVRSRRPRHEPVVEDRVEGVEAGRRFRIGPQDPRRREAGGRGRRWRSWLGQSDDGAFPFEEAKIAVAGQARTRGLAVAETSSIWLPGASRHENSQMALRSSQCLRFTHRSYSYIASPCTTHRSET
jgi:hypothetical protein